LHDLAAQEEGSQQVCASQSHRSFSAPIFVHAKTPHPRLSFVRKIERKNGASLAPAFSILIMNQQVAVNQFNAPTPVTLEYRRPFPSAGVQEIFFVCGTSLSANGTILPSIP